MAATSFKVALYEHRARPTMRRFGFRRGLAILLIVLIVWMITVVVGQLQFESYLNSFSIGFDDFPAGYNDSLIAGMASEKPLTYPYATWPEPDTHSTIPKIIHFIWFKDLYNHHLDVSEIPHAGSDSPQMCLESDENFTIYTWNASAARALLEEHYSWFIPVYESYPHPIQRVDAFKYFALWHYGGIYMDLDVQCRRSLLPLLAFPAWFPKATLFGVNNDVMASRKHHPVIWEMIQSLKGRNWNLLFPYLTIFWSTGPKFASDVLQSYWRQGKANGDDEGFQSDAVYVLPLPFYSEEYTFFGHTPGGTWHGTDVLVVEWLVKRRWAVLAILSVLVSAGIWMHVRMRRNSRKLR